MQLMLLLLRKKTKISLFNKSLLKLIEFVYERSIAIQRQFMNIPKNIQHLFLLTYASPKETYQVRILYFPIYDLKFEPSDILSCRTLKKSIICKKKNKFCKQFFNVQVSHNIIMCMYVYIQPFDYPICTIRIKIRLFITSLVLILIISYMSWIFWMHHQPLQLAFFFF